MSSQDFNTEKSMEKFLEYNEIEKEYMKYDNKLKNLNEDLIKWLRYIDSNDKDVFIKLFENFSYFDRHKIIENLEELYGEYKKRVVDYHQTIFLPVTSLGGVLNGAISVIECFKEATSNEIHVSKKHIATQPYDFNNEFSLSEVKNIVLIDDVIGSGDTLINFLYRLVMKTQKLLYQKNIYILSLINLKKGLSNVKKFSDDHEWDLRFINNSYIESCFKNKTIYPYEKDAQEDKRKIRKYEKAVATRKVDIMGYKKSETLLAFFFNTPNNTLSTFWNKVDNKWDPLFPRDKDEDVFSLNKENSLKEIKKNKELKKKKQYFITKFMNEEKQARRIL